MRSYALIFVFFLINGCYTESDEIYSSLETTTELLPIISEKEIEKLDGGFCKFQIR